MGKTLMAKPEHEVAYQDLVALLRKSADQNGLSSAELLAVAGNMIGKLVAMQDQRTMTPREAMLIISANLEHGNAQILRKLAGESNGSA